MTRDMSGRWTACKMTGHAGQAEWGHDIVCSAVSVLGVTCVNSLETLCGVIAKIEDNREGILSFSLPENLNKNQEAQAQLLMGSLHVGLQDVAQEYPDNLTLSIQIRRETK